MILLFTVYAFAHKPSFGPNSSMNDAFVVEDPNISIVVYQEMTCEDDQLWLGFYGEEGFELYIQAGVPEVNRLEAYTPKVAVLAPGLPQVTVALPFEVPEGMGGVVYDSDEIPTPFYEPFTQTSSWVWVEERLELPQTGEGFIVGWNEEEVTGKLWLATGEVEDFSDVGVSEFIVWNEYVNNFHETGRFEPVIPKEEISCILAEDEGTAKNGCGGINALFIFPLMMTLRNRKKSTVHS